MTEYKKEYRVSAIKNGTVIDHISRGKALKACEVLNIGNEPGSVTIGMHFESKKHGSKDFIKIEDKELSHEEVSKLALIAPNATVNIIKDYKVVKKIEISVPDTIIGIVACPNPNCITNHEQDVQTRFALVSKLPLKLKCNFCERVIKHEEVILR